MRFNAEVIDKETDKTLEEFASDDYKEFSERCNALLVASLKKALASDNKTLDEQNEIITSLMIEALDSDNVVNTQALEFAIEDSYDINITIMLTDRLDFID